MSFKNHLLKEMMTMTTSITSGQRKQYKRFVEDVAERALEEAGLDKDSVQELIEHGDVLQADILSSIRKHSVIKLDGLALSADPIKIQKAWTQLYAKWGIKYSVPEVPFTLERIQVEKERNRILIYLAPELSSTSALPELGRIFPAMQSWSVSGDDNAKKIKNATDLSGWLFVEAELNTPNPDTTEADLRKIFSKQNAKGMTLNTYIIFGQFYKEVFGEYSTESLYVRLLGSSDDGGVLGTCFFSDGRLYTDLRWGPRFCVAGVGGRSVAV